ncbi:MAG: winged helix-turn-helix transcriptional regulator [Sphingomonadaceae bacterium]|nr:winged helix-turn-helix transcriptional regulator [Sphingomonadaceae bacterium]
MELEKITKDEKAGPRRWYEDACGAAHALDIVGERWALLVMRELMLGPKRFTDLRASLPGISANVLTQRLEGLEAAGVLVKRRLPPPVSAQVYQLTPWGYESEPIFQTLGRWAARSPTHDPSLPLTATSLLMSFRTMIVRDRAAGMEAVIGFRIGGESFRVHVHDGEIDAVRGAFEDASLVFTMDVGAVMAGAVYAGQMADLEAAGTLTIEGDRALADKFITLFELPPKVGAAG